MLEYRYALGKDWVVDVLPRVRFEYPPVFIILEVDNFHELLEVPLFCTQADRLSLGFDIILRAMLAEHRGRHRARLVEASRALLVFLLQYFQKPTAPLKCRSVAKVLLGHVKYFLPQHIFQLPDIL